MVGEVFDREQHSGLADTDLVALGQLHLSADRVGNNCPFVVLKLQ